MFFANFKKSEIENFKGICLQHKIKSLHAFGSAVDPD